MKGENRRFILNTLSLYASESACRLAQFVFLIIAARILQPGRYGDLALALTLIAISATVSEFGSGILVTKRVAQDPYIAPAQIRQATLLKAILTIPTIASLILYLSFRTTTEETWNLVLAASIGTIFSLHTGPVAAALRGLNRITLESLLRSSGIIVTAACSTIAILLGTGLSGIGIGIMLGSMTSGILHAWVAFHEGWFAPNNNESIARLFRAATPFGLQAIVSILYLRSGSLILEYTAGPTQLGIYSAAYRLVEPLYILPRIFACALFPTLTACLTSGDRDRTRHISTLSIRLFFSLGLPLSVVIHAAAVPIISLLYPGTLYAPSSTVLKIVCWSCTATFISTFTSTLINISQKPQINTYIAFVMLILSIVLNISLTPTLGAHGAAIATLAVEWIGLIVSLPYLPSLAARISPMQVLPRPLAAALLSSPTLLIPNPFCGSSVFLLLYLATLAIFERRRSIPQILNFIRKAKEKRTDSNNSK